VLRAVLQQVRTVLRRNPGLSISVIAQLLDLSEQDVEGAIPNVPPEYATRPAIPATSVQPLPVTPLPVARLTMPATLKPDGRQVYAMLRQTPEGLDLRRLAARLNWRVERARLAVTSLEEDGHVRVNGDVYRIG